MSHREPNQQGGAEHSVPLRIDALLRFDPGVAERYERERGGARNEALRRQMIIGVLFYNAYDLASVLLMPDISWLTVVLRTFAITPGSLLLAYAVGFMPSRWREWSMAGGMSIVFAVSMALFWWSRAPLAGYALGELPLTLVFANMLLTLRFERAVVFTACAFGVGAGAVMAKPDLDLRVQIALVLQLALACAFSLYGNYRIEADRCRNYLDELRALLKIDQAEAARNRFLDLSITDALTGLPNRRALDETVRRWAAEGRSFAVMMIDVDHFKLFNDSLGHPAGDACLRAIAGALSGDRPATDQLLARFGGEEFTLVASAIAAFPAARLAAGLVEAVERLGIVHPARRDGTSVVTVSVGVAFAGADADWERAFEAADAALYDAKRNGRNRHAVATAPAGGARLCISA